MDNNTNKEKWISEVLDSTSGMKRAQPASNVVEGVTARLARPSAIVRTPVARWAAAAVFLIAVNISSVIYYNRHNGQATSAALTGENAIASEIQAGTTYNY